MRERRGHRLRGSTGATCNVHHGRDSVKDAAHLVDHRVHEEPAVAWHAMASLKNALNPVSRPQKSQ